VEAAGWRPPLEPVRGKFMRRRRSLSVLALVAALTLVGAACGQEEAGGPGGGGGFEPGPLGAVTVGPDEPLEFGVIQVISGDTASLGEDQVRGIEIAVDDLGGEFRGHPIEMQVEDGQCTAEGGTTAAQAIVSNEQNVGIIGTSCSGEAVPASQIMSEAGFTMISGSNTSPILTSVGGEEGEAHQEGYFRTAHNDEIQGAAAARFVYEELGIGRAATINDGDPYTEGMTSAFGQSYEELGGTVTLATAVGPEDTDMRPVLTEVEASGAELIFFPIFQPAGDFVAKQAREIGFQAKALMGADGLLSDTFVTLPATEGMYFSGPETPSGQAYTEFVQKYEEAYGEPPIQAFHAHAYDATMILFEALEQVAVEEDDGTLNIDRQELRDAVGATEGYQGITGTLTCDEFGDCANIRIQVFQNTPQRKTIDQVRSEALFTFDPEQQG
jgi:branched-chain amino acid transport system substrate-binding protein